MWKLAYDRWDGVLAISMPKLTQIVIFCNLEFCGGKPLRHGKSFALYTVAFNGLHAMLSRHLQSLFSVFLLVCPYLNAAGSATAIFTKRSFGHRLLHSFCST